MKILGVIAKQINVKKNGRSPPSKNKLMLKRMEEVLRVKTN